MIWFALWLVAVIVILTFNHGAKISNLGNVCGQGEYELIQETKLEESTTTVSE